MYTLIGLLKSKKFTFGGDLNSKHRDWNSRLTTLRGRKLVRHADRNNYALYAPDSPTYYSKRMNVNPDVLDNSLNQLEDAVALNVVNSSQNPILFTDGKQFDKGSDSGEYVYGFQAGFEA